MGRTGGREGRKTNTGRKIPQRNREHRGAQRKT
jgi:hypothetical protein